jgi:hypothetical protein
MKRKTAVTVYIGGAICLLGVLLVWAYSQNKISAIAPDVRQKSLLNSAKEIICSIDEAICVTEKNETIRYTVVNYYDVLNQYYLFHKSVVCKTGNDYEIQLSRFLFEDIAALTVFLYHELYHIRSSDYSLYEKDASQLKKCQDHNKVKKATIVFVEKLDAWLKETDKHHSEKSAIFYSGLPGNKLDKCRQ